MISNPMEEVKVNGWNMLDSYKEGQAIYGRNSEIALINESIRYNVQTFLYGKSGIGKTSLIQAGIFPKLRKEHFFPIIIRLAFYDKKDESLNNVIKRLVLDEAERSDHGIGKVSLHHHIIDNSDIDAMSLYEFFSKVRFDDEYNEPYIPVLVFDQFEETINNEEHWQRTVDFLKDELYDLMDNSNVINSKALPYTNYRIIISMREDYLYCLEDIVDQYSLWELRYNRFRIKALDEVNAEEVIRNTCGIGGLESGKENLIVNTIIKIVKLNSGTRFTEINTALLSLICSLLYENSENKCIRYKDLRNINLYLRSYYDDICNKIGSKATRYLERHLLTKDGRRSSLDKSEAIISGKIGQASLDYLVERRLLRCIRTDSTSYRYEYIHDLFAKMVYKKLKEDQSRLWEPELRTLSRKENRPTFLRKFILTFLVLLICWCISAITHSLTQHNTWIFWELTCCPSFVFLLQFLFFVYLLPLVAKRLHDVNRTGWLCFIIPFSAFLVNIRHFLPALAGKTAIYSIVGFVGYIPIGYLLYLCLRTSKAVTKPRGFSREYEKVYNMELINNLEFIKFLSFELIWWIISCCVADMVLFSYNKVDTWYFFRIEKSLIILEEFGLTITLPAVISLLPFTMSFSPALHARVKSLGYPVWISYIPYFNLLLLIEGLFPNKILIKLRLIRINKEKTLQESDDIFAEVSDYFTIIDNTKSATANLRDSLLLLLALFVPFYGTIKGFNNKEKFGLRQGLVSFSILNSYILFCILIIYDINIPDLIFIILILIMVLSVGFVFVQRFSTRKIIVRLINKHPSYSIEQIAAELFLQPKSVEKIINNMKKTGKLLRVEENGQVVWKIGKEMEDNGNH